ncbi:MAG: HAD family hydrolase [Campylobacterales bacterium]|nr:HAD family hydrolase [Campylobacterales bacterium]
MPKSKALCIFDMDGTLIDSSKVIVNAINYVRGNMSLAPLDDDYILKSVNDTLLNPAKHFYGVERFEPIHEEWFSSYYSNNHNSQIELYEGIGELLEALKSKDTKLAIATNAYRISAIESLKHTGIYEFFDEIVTYDDVNKVGKPHPDMLFRVLHNLSIPAAASIFVGDSHKDRVASSQANIDFLMVNWGFSDHSEDVVDTPNKLYEILI